MGNLILLFADLAEFANISFAKIFGTYKYKMIVHSKPQTFNPQTLLFTANHEI